jgi:hypothetical protein
MKEQINDLEQIELRSSEVQEILSKPPAALVRYGTVLICIIMTLLIASTFYFKYPDIVSGTATITTDDSGKIIAHVKIPVSLIYKIKEGQQVNIKADMYPYLKFGYLKGEISNISPDSDKQYYTFLIKMQDGLMTSNNNMLKFTGELTGVADILTDNRSIFERIFGQIYNLFKISG